MFNFFKKKTPKSNDLLKSYQHKDKYFYRIAKWDWMTPSQIVIYAPPRMITLDDWPQLVFIDSRGELTVGEYFQELAGQYDGNIPVGLDEVVITEIESLLKEGLIALSNSKVILDKTFEKPLSQQNSLL